MRSSRGDSRRPTFLILGAPKCGTTALALSIAAHPDVCLSRPKEPHFFDCGYGKGLGAYLRDHYSRWSSEHAAGEATPSYLALPWVPRRIRESLPDAKLIAILRHPVERAYSSWWMFHVRGMEPLPFEDAIDENERRQSAQPIADDVASISSWAEHIRALERGDGLRLRTYLESGQYAPHLKRYFELFSREQVHVVLSDELKRDGEAVIRRLWRFLGVDADAPYTKGGPVNEAIDPAMSRWLRLARATGLMRLRRRLPESFRNAVKQRLAAPDGPPPLAPATRARLVAYFAPYTRELEGLLDVDLAMWRE